MKTIIILLFHVLWIWKTVNLLFLLGTLPVFIHLNQRAKLLLVWGIYDYNVLPSLFTDGFSFAWFHFSWAWSSVTYTFFVLICAVRSSGMRWSFPNKVSVLPQFLSFKTPQEDRHRKTILDPLASSGYMNMPTKEAFESNQKPVLGVAQVCFFFLF